MSRSRRGLQAALAALGVVAVVFGLLGVFMGVDGVRDGGTANASLESEFRYFAAWYVAGGALALWAARTVGSTAAVMVVRVLCGTLILGAAGRLIAMATVGRPHDVFVFLTAVELVYGFGVGVWSERLHRALTTPSR